MIYVLHKHEYERVMISRVTLICLQSIAEELLWNVQACSNKILLYVYLSINEKGLGALELSSLLTLQPEDFSLNICIQENFISWRIFLTVKFYQ